MGFHHSRIPRVQEDFGRSLGFRGFPDNTRGAVGRQCQADRLELPTDTDISRFLPGESSGFSSDL